jgi:hypothetical protein
VQVPVPLVIVTKLPAFEHTPLVLTTSGFELLPPPGVTVKLD